MKIFQRLLLAVILLLLLLATIAFTSCASNKWGHCPTYGKHQITVKQQQL